MLYFHLLHNYFHGGAAYTDARRLFRTSFCVLLFVSVSSTVELTSSGGQQEICSATIEVTFLRQAPSTVQQLYGKVIHLWSSERTD